MQGLLLTFSFSLLVKALPGVLLSGGGFRYFAACSGMRRVGTSELFHNKYFIGELNV